VKGRNFTSIRGWTGAEPAVLDLADKLEACSAGSSTHARTALLALIVP
jgi:hypothetical protein